MRCDLLAQAIAARAGGARRDGGVIADGYDAELDELRAIADELRRVPAGARDSASARAPASPNLKVEYNSVHGYYIEVTNAQAGKVPDDYRRRQTLKNAERYITPELKAFEDKALSAQRPRAGAARSRSTSSCSSSSQPHVPSLQQIARALAQLDVLSSFRPSALKR